jgi:hypothetical protein
MLSLHPKLFVRAAALSAELIAPLQKGLQKDSSVMLTADQFKRLRSLLAELRNEASPRLKKALDLVLKEISSKQSLKTIGITVIR